MQKLNTMILLIFCALTLQQVAGRRHHPPINYEQKKINYTEHDRRNYIQEVDLTVNFEAQSFTLSRNESHIFVNSSGTHFNPCIISFKTLSYDFQVAPLNEKIIIWDLKTESYKVVGVNLLLINPHYCNYTTIKVPADVIPKYYPPYKPQVLTYKDNDQFDIFFGGRNACLPCRFTGHGDRIAMEHQLNIVANRKIVRPYLIKPLKENQPSAGYFLAYSFYHESSPRSVINLLGSDFTHLKNISVDHFVDAVAINFRGIDICYKMEEQKYVRVTQEDDSNGSYKIWQTIPNTEVYCEVYGRQLELEKRIKLDVPSDHYVNGVSLSTSTTGSLCVAVPHISYADKGNQYSLTFFRFESLDQPNPIPLVATEKYFDDESGSLLKVKTSRLLRNHCRNN